MRVEYSFSLENVGRPSFSVETTEGPHKLFTLSTLILNVLPQSKRVDVIFHSPNREDLPKKVRAFEQILNSSPSEIHIRTQEGESGAMGSSYYLWVSILTSDADAPD